MDNDSGCVEVISGEWTVSEELVKEMQMPKKKKGFCLLYIFPLLYVVSIYFFVFCFMKNPDSALSYMIYLPLVFGVLNIIVSIVFCKPENRIRMLNAAMLVKCALIPLFVVGGVLVFMSFLLSFIPVPFMIFLGPLLGIMGIVVGWGILVLESPYAISYLHLSSKAKIRSKGMAVFHCILQFFFTLDVIDVMVLSFKEGKWRKLIVCMIVLTILILIFLFLLIVLGIASFFV